MHNGSKLFPIVYIMQRW